MDMVPLTVIVELVARANDLDLADAQVLLRIPMRQLGYSPTATRLTSVDAIELLEQLGSGITVLPPASLDLQEDHHDDRVRHDLGRDSAGSLTEP